MVLTSGQDRDHAALTELAPPGVRLPRPATPEGDAYRATDPGVVDNADVDGRLAPARRWPAGTGLRVVSLMQARCVGCVAITALLN
jgi:hypothetical protein